MMEMSIKWAGSWHWAQQCPVIRSRVGPVGVEQSDIKYQNRYYFIQPSNIMKEGWSGMGLILL